MKLIKSITAIAAIFASSMVVAQGWSDAYQKALNAAKTERWSEARTLFRQAASLRAEDFSGPTSLRTSDGKPSQWRNGASYSPNFGAAYAGYRFGLKISDETERTAMLRTVASEFQALLTKNQFSAETFYILSNTYSVLRDSSAQQKLESKRKSVQNNITWSVDADILLADDRAAIAGTPVTAQRPSETAAQVTSNAKTKPEQKAKTADETKPVPVATNPRLKPETKVPTKQDGGNPTQETAKPKPSSKPKPKQDPPKKADDKPKEDKPQKPVSNPTDDEPIAPKPKPSDGKKPAKGDQGFVRAGSVTPESLGLVVQVSNKFALLIGNTTSGIPDGALDFAATDTAIVKNSLINHGGYPEANISIINNATAEQMLEAAKALAERVTEDGTVVIYFTGVGAHLDGKDYLAGVNTEMATDSSTMIAKTALYQVFMSKGARIFAFFQANRPIIGGKSFGDEIPQVGAIAQMQATMRGSSIHSLVRDGQPVGLFTNAVGQTLNELRSNKIPIVEFAWQVFDRIRRGNTGTTGGAGTQVPTLPVLTNLAQDARF